MNKLNFISKQFQKAQNKPFELYVVTRIWHLLDDFSVKLITQQHVTRPEGRALTDMFFPQLHIHVEVDEGHHKRQIDWDKTREADIINATGHEVLRVDVTQDVGAVNAEIQRIVNHVRSRKNSVSDFKPWDIEAEQDPQTYIDKGSISLRDDCAFRTMVDAARCFGRDYKPNGIRKGGIKHPKEKGKMIWFPKLYKNGKWNNGISADETEITEIDESPETARSGIDRVLLGNIHRRIVFAKVKSPLGDIMYRFKGEYELEKELSNYDSGLLWKRVSTRVDTYGQKV